MGNEGTVKKVEEGEEEVKEGEGVEEDGDLTKAFALERRSLMGSEGEERVWVGWWKE